MKRSISLILLAAACLLALAAVTALSGCVAKPAFSDPTGGVTTPASPTGQSAVYTSGNVDMALTIPEGWQWEAVQDKELSAEGIRFRKPTIRPCPLNCSAGETATASAAPALPPRS